MIQTEAAGRVTAFLVVALAVAVESAFVGSVANGDTERSGFLAPGEITSQSFGVRLLQEPLAVPDLGGQTTPPASNERLFERLTVADISMDRELQWQARDARFNWPHNLDSGGAPIEIRQEHLAPVVRLSF